MQPYFRDAVRGDLSAIAAILRQTDSCEQESADHSGSYRDALTEIDRTEGNYVLVAEYDSEIGAMLQMVAFRHLHGRGSRTAEIAGLFVADKYRTSGIGGMLLEHAVSRAQDIGCARVQVLSSTANRDEHPFWERQGFVQLDRGYVKPLN